MKEIATLGNRTFLGTSQYLIPPNEALKLQLLFDQNDAVSLSSPVKISINIKFYNDEKSNPSAGFSPQKDGTADFVITNWNSPLGTSLNKPFELVTIEETHIVDLMLYNALIGETNFITLQFWIREL
ncbi:hypothetical protein [Pantoea ananatis]|uniref:hypothetical protein n=1 Tax=Pantoea ananas TaxID=553 RepID=UPI000CF54798|nr:hypothetical protein [Pantoea ananatis]NQE76221.1 hypothetical protein [Pantoea ananatis]NQE80856.1 hypothetical protein [Pantoea ananatis]PKC39071.1 hypothetical protein V462_06240 [Pantoea ananatis 15320]PQK73615.1 hypothetical protein CG427_12460 [Pantoea ananatis]